MASTQYTTSVTFYREVPFDNSYNHTLGAASVADKKTWLDSYSHTDFNDLMTIKVDSTTSKGTIRLNVREDYAHTYNYAYIDDNKTGKYFAFILGCRYINDGKVESGTQYSLYEFDIEVDVMNSFLTSDNQLYSCPIDRHHATGTSFNSLRTAESVAMGDYTYNEIENAPTSDTGMGAVNTTDYMILMAHIGNVEGTSTRTEVHDIQGVPQGMRFEILNHSLNPSHCKTWLQDHLNNVSDVSQVLGIYVVPYAAFTAHTQALPQPGELEDSLLNQDLIYWCISKANPSSDSDPYYHMDEYLKLNGDFKPHNEKLTYYPYNFGRLMNDMGNYVDLHFEDWGNLDRNGVAYKAIGVETTAAPPVTLRAGPINYNGFRGFERVEGGSGYHNRIDPDYKVELSNFPMGSWTCDAYQMYVAQNGQVYQNKMEYTASKALFGAAIGASTGNWAGAGSSLTSGVGALLEQYQNWNNSLQRAKDAPDVFSGSTNISNLDFAFERKKFRFAHVSIRSEFAKAIDKYFSRYGYSQAGRVGKPVSNGRPYFTYIKTLDECYNPSTTTKCSMNQQKKVNEIFMNGCTFWNISTATKNDICMFGTLYNNNSNSDH